MKSILIFLGSAMFAQLALAGDGPGNSALNLAQKCLQNDVKTIQQNSPVEIERSIKQLTFQSEIFYQIFSNRVGYVSENLKLVDDYKKISDEVDQINDSYSQLTSKFRDENPEARKYGTPESDALDKLSGEWSEKVNKGIADMTKFSESLATNPKLADYIKEVTRKLTADTSSGYAKYSLADKSYGDYLTRMATKAQSCEQLHAQYQKLAIEAKRKRNFKLETISTLHFVNLDRMSVTEANREFRKMLNDSGYRKAAETYSFSRNSSIGLALTTGSFVHAIDNLGQALNGKGVSDKDPIFDLGSKNQTAQQLEKKLTADFKKVAIERHAEVTKGISNLLK